MTDAGVTGSEHRPAPPDFRRRALRGLSIRAVSWAIGVIACTVGAIDNQYIFRWLFIIAAAQCLFQLSLAALAVRRILRSLRSD
jgi:hypothetical protein